MNVGVHMNSVSFLVVSYDVASVALTLSTGMTVVTRDAVAIFLPQEPQGDLLYRYRRIFG